MSLFINEAHAAAGAPAGADGTSMLIMLAVFGLVFYFMIYRPQAKRVKEHADAAIMACPQLSGKRWD